MQDLDRATQIGWQMVAQLGMSERLGNVEYSRNYKILSSETKAAVETELKRTLDEAYQRARKLLLSRRKELELLAKALVQYETLDLDEVDKVLRGEKLPNRVPVPLGPMTVRRPEALESPPPSGVPGLAPIPGSDVTDGGGKTPPGPPAAGGLAAREGRRNEN
jgi:ATP-dependent metalloprotease